MLLLLQHSGPAIPIFYCSRLYKSIRSLTSVRSPHYIDSKGMAPVLDDKSEIVIPFILQYLEAHKKHSDEPFFIGLNGVQGVGKTTLVL